LKARRGEAAEQVTRDMLQRVGQQAECLLKACANNKCNLITLGGVNEVVLIVLTSVADQK
jgi:hypothetical protein